MSLCQEIGVEITIVLWRLCSLFNSWSKGSKSDSSVL